MFTIQPISAFTDNYIWLLFDADTREAFVVDPGDHATNPFLRCEQPQMLEALRRQGKLQNEDPVAVFSAVRG